MDKLQKTKQRRRTTISVASAKNPKDDSASKLYRKINNVKDIYALMEPLSCKKNQERRYFSNKGNTQDFLKSRKDISVTANKDMQELYEQNMLMKRQMNKVQEQLSILKGRYQVNRKRRVRKDKTLQIQFQKQLYWTGSQTHMVAGIKNQYQKLKKEYEQKCEQNKQLKRDIVKSRIPQLLCYNEQLQTQNRRLSNEVEKGQKQKQKQKKQGEQKNIFDLQQSLIKLQLKVKTTKDKLKQTTKELNEKEMKIRFLQKLIIQKQNNQYHANQKVRRQNKEKQKFLKEHKELKQQFQYYMERYDAQVSKIKQKCSDQIIQEKYLRERSNKEKDNIIRQLQENIQQLDAAITDLQIAQAMGEKKLDLTQLMYAKQSRLNKTQSNIYPKNHNNNLNKTMNINLSKPNNTNTNNKNNLNILDNMNTSNEDASSSRRANNYQSTIGKVLKEVQQPPSQVQVRVQKTAQRPHSQKSKKVRKVESIQIQGIVEYLHYRLIQADVDPSTLKNFFDYEVQKQSSKYDEWEAQYINMKSTKNIFQEKPFGLGQYNAELIARYIIQDAQQQYIYCDDENQQRREVAKSILKSLLSEYEVCSQQVKQQYTDLLNKYTPNIVSALKTVCPSGKVGMKKLLQVLDSLGLQVSQQLKKYLIAKLSVFSESLQFLHYHQIFKIQEQ